MKVEEFASSRVWKREGRNTVGFPCVPLSRKRRAEEKRRGAVCLIESMRKRRKEDRQAFPARLFLGREELGRSEEVKKNDEKFEPIE